MPRCNRNNNHFSEADVCTINLEVTDKILRFYWEMVLLEHITAPATTKFSPWNFSWSFLRWKINIETFDKERLEIKKSRSNKCNEITTVSLCSVLNDFSVESREEHWFLTIVCYRFTIQPFQKFYKKFTIHVHYIKHA